MDKLKARNSFWFSLFKGAFVATSISLVGILIFALLIKFLNIGEGWILPINQIIKVISIFVGVLLSFSHNKSKGFVKGFLIGVVYTILAYTVFSILAGKFSFGLTSFNDMIFGGFIGGISGIISVNLKK